MSEEKHKHGSTPAAWTAVTIVMIAFLIGMIAVVTAIWPLFWVAVALAAIGGITGRVMSMMGYGLEPKSS